jgi:adenine-specific DNA-methyltransferase
MASGTRTPKPAKNKPARNYRHPESESPIRPEVGTQAQFKKKLPPQKYRYDDSLSPALEWGGQNPARGRVEVLRRVLELVSLEQAKTVLSKSKVMSKPLPKWSGNAEELSFGTPALTL